MVWRPEVYSHEEGEWRSPGAQDRGEKLQLQEDLLTSSAVLSRP